MPFPLQDRSFEAADAGTRIRVVSALVACSVLVAGTVAFVKIPTPVGPSVIPAMLVAVAVPFMFGVYWVGARIQGYRLTGSSLVVERRFFSRRFSLEALASAELAENVMRGAWKVMGNGGLGAVSGSFRSRRWGFFKAYLTDTNSCVVLTWSGGRRVILSPADTRSFLDEVRKRMT